MVQGLASLTVSASWVHLRRHVLATLLVLFAFNGGLHAQTTQGVISGEIRDSLTDQPLSHATVFYMNLESGLGASVDTNLSGNYTLPLLSPGQYRLRVIADGYQIQELYDLNLAVGGRLDVRFHLRRSDDVWEAKQFQTVVLPESNNVLAFYGPDVDPNRIASFRANHGEASNLDTSVSDVIDSRLLRDLPLLGRDVYSLLVVLPAVTADTTTGRGVNVSVAGQRPSSSNFLLDGIESNNYLVTGPLAALTPESIQEYRISTNNYSAEYGRTGSFVANAITRSGNTAWHGSGWLFFKNDVLNANGFQENLNGIRRAPLHEIAPGLSIGGPILKKTLFTAISFERIRFRSQADPQDFLLPAKSFAASLSPASSAGRLLLPFVSILPDAPSLFAQVTLNRPTALNQTSVVDRTDYTTRSGKQRLTARIAFYDFSEPGLLFNPYPGFSSTLAQQAVSVAAAWTISLTSSITNEARAGRSGQRFSLDRPHAEVPVLASTDHVRLPGSQSFNSLGDRDRTLEFLDNISVAAGKHFYKFGAGWLGRRINSAVSSGLQGNYLFDGLQKFAAGTPLVLLLTYDRSTNDLAAVPQFNREYGYNQAYVFAQDSYQLSRSLTLNFGMRYEFFGAPANTGPIKDTLIALGQGDTFEQRLSKATFAPPEPGRQQLYSAREGNWAGRFAFAFDPRRNGGTVVRGSYGIFYDRPFDNYWQTVATNSLQLGFSSINAPVDFLLPPHRIASGFPLLSLQPPVEPVLFQPELRAARVQSAFLSIEQRISDPLVFQLLGIGAFAHSLVTTDQINRANSVAPGLPVLDYRANQGKSNYLGASAILRYRTRLAEGQVSYTLSHAIDIQSDPLAGAFLNFNVGSTLTAGGSPTIAAFTRQFDSQGDRANADFDQRHNLVFYSVFESPVFAHPAARRWLTHWRLGTIAAFRSGFPFGVIAPEAAGSVYKNNRADLIAAPSAVYTNTAIDGGRQLLNPNAFRAPSAGAIGNTGRNAFHGPGLFNVDLSLAREFAIPRLGETRRLTVRANMFNFLNHANLGNPSGALCCGFGQAYYGRTETSNGFPTLLPLVENARQIQLMLRVDF